MKLIAIDPGLEKVGYSIFDKSSSQNYIYITSGLIKTSKKDAHEQRLSEIFDQLSLLIDLHKPEILIMEQLFFFKNAKTVIHVAQAQGVIQLLSFQKKLRFMFLTPLQIKQIITGYGNADKASVHKMLKLLLKQEVMVSDDDESDAIACGLAYCCINEKLL